MMQLAVTKGLYPDLKKQSTSQKKNTQFFKNEQNTQITQKGLRSQVQKTAQHLTSGKCKLIL